MNIPGEMVAGDRHSWVVGGRRVWLHAGEIHYFRLDPGSWRDSLLRLRAAGGNTVSTYIPWNYHETAPGRFDFSSERDLPRFLDLAATLGLWVIVRPGPYICAEWDGGGLPFRLHASGRVVRSNDPGFLAETRTWFDAVFPHLVPRQADRGGPVVLVQIENEFGAGWSRGAAEDRRYLMGLNREARERGITVPLTWCHAHPGPEGRVRINYSLNPEDQVLDPGTTLTYNAALDVEPVEALRTLQPDAPLLVSEFWTGGITSWNTPPRDWPGAGEQTLAAFRFMAHGAQVSFYMFEGGMNFGFWAANDITTRYGDAYPVLDGGILTAKYHALRLPGLLTSTLADELAASTPGEAQTSGGWEILQRHCPSGTLYFLNRLPGATPSSTDQTWRSSWGEIHPLSCGSAVLPVNWSVSGTRRAITRTNVSLIAQWEHTFLFAAPAGTPACIETGGGTICDVIPAEREVFHSLDGFTFILADERRASRCWRFRSSLWFGPHYLADDPDAEAPRPLVREPVAATLHDLTTQSTTIVRLEPAALPEPPVLSAWQTFPALSPDGAQRDGWRELPEPRFQETLGIERGYCWYAAEFDSRSGQILELFAASAPNRMLAFNHGQFQGLLRERSNDWQEPLHAHRKRLFIELCPGPNRLVFLSDNLGHNHGGVADPNGFCGPVFLGGRRLPPGQWREEGRTLHQETPLATGETLILRMDARPEAAELRLDGAVVPWIPPGSCRGNAACIPPAPHTRTIRLTVHALHLPLADLRPRLEAAVCEEHSRLRSWKYRPLELPDFDPTAVPAPTAAAPQLGSQPVLLAPENSISTTSPVKPHFLKASFPAAEHLPPLFLHLGGLQKGQVWINGRNLGRYWVFGGAPHRLHVPAGWLQPLNEMVIFDEFGSSPRAARFEYDFRTGVPAQPA